MDIRPNRMVSLGYGRYWRSDAIVGLMPIESERGPGRRTEVYTTTIDEPIVASRSERAILRDIAVAGDERFQIQEAREMLSDLLDAFDDFPDVLGRMLLTESRFNVPDWTQRLRTFLESESSASTEQNDLFDQAG